MQSRVLSSKREGSTLLGEDRFWGQFGTPMQVLGDMPATLCSFEPPTHFYLTITHF